MRLNSLKLPWMSANTLTYSIWQCVQSSVCVSVCALFEMEDIVSSGLWYDDDDMTYMAESVTWRRLLCECKSWWLQRSVLSNPLFIFFIAEGNRAECIHSFWGVDVDNTLLFCSPLSILYSADSWQIFRAVGQVAMTEDCGINGRGGADILRMRVSLT